MTKSNVIPLFGNSTRPPNPLLTMSEEEILEGLFDNEANYQMLGVEEIGSLELADLFEVFYDAEVDRNKVFVDIDSHSARPNIRGLYEIEPRTFMLTRISDTPLRNFS